jgi:hypothetical protein
MHLLYMCNTLWWIPIKILLIRVRMYERCSTSKVNWGRKVHTENQECQNDVEYTRCIATGLWMCVGGWGWGWGCHLAFTVETIMLSKISNYTTYVYKVPTPTSRTRSARYWVLTADCDHEWGNELRTRPSPLARSSSIKITWKADIFYRKWI